jgi:hypothetical protein
VKRSEKATPKRRGKTRTAPEKLLETVRASPEARLLLDEILDGRRADFEALVYKALKALNEALDARKYFVVTVGKGVSQVVESGPDHFARMAAVRELRSLGLARRPQPKEAEPPPRTLTIEEVKKIAAGA